MAEYIKREALLVDFGEEPMVWDEYDEEERQERWDWRRYKRIVESQPAADVVEVRHGRWDYHSHTMQECSVCKKHTARHRFNYCPNCGARMDGTGDV